jgi:hypothetical protein
MTTKRRNTPLPPLPAYKERLRLNAQSNMLDFSKTLIEIIEQEAWTPTYESFTEAYTDKLGNITFARELLPHIMYAMFNEGTSPEAVADAIKGVVPEAAERIKKQKDSGVPASRYTVPQAPHSSSARSIHFRFSGSRIPRDCHQTQPWQTDGVVSSVAP